jgi:hypothetical protein
MSNDDGQPVRPWQEIVEEASRERDPDKLEQLSKELTRALEERDNKLPPQGRFSAELAQIADGVHKVDWL